MGGLHEDVVGNYLPCILQVVDGDTKLRDPSRNMVLLLAYGLPG